MIKENDEAELNVLRSKSANLFIATAMEYRMNNLNSYFCFGIFFVEVLQKDILNVYRS
jgi:hypothetical protein